MLRRFSEYNNWANSLLLDSLTAITLSGGVALPDYCIKLLSHIANAQTIWANRIVGNVPQVTVWQVHDFYTCKEMLLKSGEDLLEFTSTDAVLDGVIKYKISTGELFETAVADVLLHTFNHSTYHRAQIAKELKLNNIEPVNTDYIQFVRRR